MDKLVLKPLVSVAIPSYNHASFVKDAIRSVINQTYENIELIIIDDGSADQSLNKIEELIDECKQRFVRFEFRHRSNKGLCETLNEALDWSHGEFFCALASDDQILENKLSDQVEYLSRHPSCAAVFGAISFIDQNNEIIGSRIKTFKKYNFKEILLHKHELPAPTQLIRMDIINKTSKYNPKLRIEDWDMWLKLSKYGSLDYIPDVVSLYRMHENNTIKNFNLMSTERLKIINQYKENKYYPKAWRNVKLMEHEFYYEKNHHEKSLLPFFQILKKYPYLFTRFKYIKRLFTLLLSRKKF